MISAGYQKYPEVDCLALLTKLLWQAIITSPFLKVEGFKLHLHCIAGYGAKLSLSKVYMQGSSTQHGSIVLPWVQNVLGDAWSVLARQRGMANCKKDIGGTNFASRHQRHALELSPLSLRSMRFSPVFQGNDPAARHQWAWRRASMSNHSEMRSGCNRQVTQTQARNPQNMRQKVALLSDFWNRNPDKDFMWFHNKYINTLSYDESLEAFIMNHLSHAVWIACKREQGKGTQKKSKEVRICQKHSETLFGFNPLQLKLHTPFCS